MVCGGPSELARQDSGGSDPFSQCASTGGHVGEDFDAASILKVGGSRPPPAVATHGRQRADSAVASTHSPVSTPEVDLFTGRQAPEEACHVMTGLVGGVIP